MNDKAKNIEPGGKKIQQHVYEDELFLLKRDDIDEIESDGSASAFDETESVNEDNFDNLSEK